MSTSRRLLKASSYLTFISIAFWLAETAYFGWNATPINAQEKACDHIAMWGVVAAVLIRIEVVCQFVIDKVMPSE